MNVDSPSPDFVRDIVPRYSDIEFKQNFGFPRQVMNTIAADFELSDYYQNNPKEDKHGNRISSQKCLLAFFCWIHSTTRLFLDEVSEKFNISDSVLEEILDNVASFLAEINNNERLRSGTLEE